MRFDAEKIRAETRLHEVIERAGFALKRDGKEWKGLCPFHTEKSPSFSVFSGDTRFYCFGCQAHGDAIDFVCESYGLDFKAACEFLGGERTAVRTARKPRPVVLDEPGLYSGLVAPEEDEPPLPEPGKPLRCWNPKRADEGRGWVTYTPSMVFPYRSFHDDLLGLVVRVDLGEGRKLTPTLRRAVIDGKPAWCHWPFDRPRPLYGLNTIGDAKQVLVVEGEKAADALRRMLPGRAVVSWPGGGKSIAHVDWSHVAGLHVLIWGDADTEGERTILGWDDKPGVAALCAAAGAVAVKYVPWDHTREPGWDAADAEAEGWDAARTLAWLRERAVAWSAPEPPAATDPVATPEPQAPQPVEKPVENDQPQDSSESDGGEEHETEVPDFDTGDGDTQSGHGNNPSAEFPFRILGYDGENFFYLGSAGQQITQLTAQSHTVNNLLRLAPSEYWESTFETRAKSRAPFNVARATDALIQACYSRGIFSERRLRGRGAWIDEHGRPVIHLGNVVYVDGVPHRPADVPSRYLYERKEPLGVAADQPANNKEAHRLVEICERLTWVNPLSGALLAGWCVVAPVCGALKWRPTIWITGPTEAGKSTAVNEVVGRVVGPIAERAEGGTTEAGLRRLMLYDARPIIVDELESEGRAQQAQTQGVMLLARIAASGGTITKGSANGGQAVSYTIRSAFCFSSINTAIKEGADERRISRLVLQRNTAPNAQQHFEGLTRDIAAWFTGDYASRMLARTVKYLPTLLKNIGTFQAAASVLMHSRGAADQLAPMLAGYYLCHRTDEIDFAAAKKWIQDRNWEDFTALRATRDEDRLLERILQIRKTIRNGRGAYDVTVGEMIESVFFGRGFQTLDRNVLQAELGRCGIRVLDDEKGFAIANGSYVLEAALADTQWGKDYRNTLMMLAGATKYKQIRYCPGMNKKGTFIPIDLLGPDEERAERNSVPTQAGDFDGCSDGEAESDEHV